MKKILISILFFLLIICCMLLVFLIYAEYSYEKTNAKLTVNTFSSSNLTSRYSNTSSKDHSNIETSELNSSETSNNTSSEIDLNQRYQYNIPKTITYTNLIDKEVKDEVKNRLLNAGIPKDNISLAFSWIDDYNQYMGNTSTAKNGFITVEFNEFDFYDWTTQSTIWYKNRSYPDILCRIAAFNFIEDKLTIKKATSYDNWLKSDAEIFNSNPLSKFKKESISKYFTLFNPVYVDANMPDSKAYEAIKKDWKTREISFEKGTTSLVSVWLRTNNAVFIGHTGILIEDEKGLLFFEKCNPSYPFQVTKFESIEDVKGYLMYKLKTEYEKGDSASPIFVTMNDNVI